MRHFVKDTFLDIRTYPAAHGTHEHAAAVQEIIKADRYIYIYMKCIISERENLIHVYLVASRDMREQNLMTHDEGTSGLSLMATAVEGSFKNQLAEIFLCKLLYFHF